MYIDQATKHCKPPGLYFVAVKTVWVATKQRNWSWRGWM